MPSFFLLSLLATIIMGCVGVFFIWVHYLFPVKDKDLFTNTQVNEVVGTVDDGRGDDAYYVALPHKRSMYHGRFQFKFESDDAFRVAMEKARVAGDIYASKHIPIVEEDLPTVDRLPDDWTGGLEGWPRRDTAKTIQYRYHVPTQTVYMCVSHATVGGGDFLLMCSSMFYGTATALIDPPSFGTGMLCAASFIWWCLRNGCFNPTMVPHTSHDPKDWRRFQFNFPMDSCEPPPPKPGQLKVMTRTMVAFRVLSLLADSLHIATKRPLRVIFTVGFKHVKGKQKNALKNNVNTVNNSIGVIPVFFARGDSVEVLQKRLNANASHAYGAYWLMTNSKGRGSAARSSTSRIWCDVVFSMARINEATNAGDQLRTMLASQMWGMPFSSYSAVLTVNGQCKVGMSLSTKECDFHVIKQRFPDAEDVLFPWEEGGLASFTKVA